MNTCHNDNRALPPIQLIVPLCQTVDDAGSTLAWLHGYCLATFRIVGAGIRLDGTLAIGKRYGENLGLINDLASALDAGAVLAAYDCHDLISRLGRLPIEANDPKPALELLAMLKCMLNFHDPIDLAIDDDSQTEVAVQYLRLPVGMDQETRDALDDDLFETGWSNETDLRPHRVASDLIESTRAYIGAIGALYFAEEMRSPLLTAWDAWERAIQPQIEKLSFEDEIGGEPIQIS